MNPSTREIDQKRAHLRRENARYQPGVFALMPKDSWPNNGQSQIRPETCLVAVRRSRDFLVQIFSEANGITRLSVNRTDIDHTGRWRDGITWDELQAVKNGCGFADFHAVECYPKSGHVVNVANMRHLWILPDELTPYFWTPRSQAAS